MSRIIAETSRVIYDVLREYYFSVPRDARQWKMIAKDFERLWQFPHVLGAIDGEHIRIQAPTSRAAFIIITKAFLAYNFWLCVMLGVIL